MTHNKSFGSRLKTINELRKHIYYILDNIFVFFYQSKLRIEPLTGYKIMTRSGYFPGYGSPGIKMCRKSCINPGYGNFPGYGNYPGYGS